MSTKHIVASNMGLRHFSRHTEECNYAKGESCNYENRFVGQVVSKDPPSFPKTGYGRHHILPVGAVGLFETFDGYDNHQRDQIRGVYEATEWCISRPMNLIVLPVKRTYAGFASSDVRRLDLPCHDVDHGCAQGYTDEVTAKVEARIWKKFKKANDQGHPQADQVLADLVDLETRFRGELERRGRRKGGTDRAIEALAPNSQQAPEGVEPWLPFSMADNHVASRRKLLSLGGSPEWFGKKLESRYPRPKKKASK